MNDLISLSTSNSPSSSFEHPLRRFNLMKQCNDVQSDFKGIGQALCMCTLNSKADVYCKTFSNVFCKSNKELFSL